jgi:hypothetical protein
MNHAIFPTHCLGQTPVVSRTKACVAGREERRLREMAGPDQSSAPRPPQADPRTATFHIPTRLLPRNLWRVLITESDSPSPGIFLPAIFLPFSEPCFGGAAGESGCTPVSGSMTRWRIAPAPRRFRSDRARRWPSAVRRNDHVRLAPAVGQAAVDLPDTGSIIRQISVIAERRAA